MEPKGSALSQMNSVFATPSLIFNTVFKNIFISSATNYVLCYYMRFITIIQANYEIKVQSQTW